MPVWQQLYSELKDKNFMVVAVAEESRGTDHARPWIEQAKSSYWQLIDAEHRLEDLYNLVNVPQAVGGEAVAGTFFGLIAVLLARKGRLHVERTLSRVGEGTTRTGKWLGLLGLCLGLTAALALGFYGLLLSYE